jgi:hypothetical protein
MDIPRPFAPAPRHRAHALLGLYQDAAAAAAEASAEAGEAAAAVPAPSYVLTAARGAAHPGLDASPGEPQRATREPAIAAQPPEPAGAVQNVLHGLGITSPGLLQRAADLDHASEQLIIEAAEQGGIRRKPPSPVTPDRSASSPELTHGARASGDPRAATLPHDQAFGHQHEPPEAEAEL